MIETYKKKILTLLLEKYERSVLLKRRAKTTCYISLKYDAKNLGEYVDEDSYLYEDSIDKATEELEKSNFIKTFYKKDGKILKVNLNLDRLDDIYSYVGRTNPNVKRNNFLKILSDCKCDSQVLSDVCNYLENEINAFHSIDIYAKNETELKKLLYLIDKIAKQKEEISLRVFSTKYLNDSKKLEQIAPKIETLIKKSSVFKEDNILEQFNIVKNPSMLIIKGTGKFMINEQEIDLEKINSVFILSFEHLKRLKVLELDIDRVTTIENLTTFYNYPVNNRELVIYLGGFHNHLRREFLKIIYNFSSCISFVHIGDIDAGGFYILNHLIEDTSIPFSNQYMDVETLVKYKKYTKRLTEEDRKRLEQLLKLETAESYREVILYMLENNQKLEQEAIDFSK